MIEDILDGLHVVAVTAVEVDEGEVGAVGAQVEDTLLELPRVHACLLEERLIQQRQHFNIYFIVRCEILNRYNCITFLLYGLCLKSNGKR